MLPGTPENVSSSFNRKLASVDFTEVPCSDRLHSTHSTVVAFFFPKSRKFPLRLSLKPREILSSQKAFVSVSNNL